MLPVESTFKTYTGLDGKPLTNGFVFLGLPNENPVTSPIEVYWDAAGTEAALQPLRTTNGYIVRSGTPANVFVSGNYSELVQDKKGQQVHYSATSENFSFGSILSGGTGAQRVGFQHAGEAIEITVEDALRFTVDAAAYIENPGASDSLDQAGVQKAVDVVAARGGGRVRVRKPIRNSWFVDSLAIPASVSIDDERNSDAGHTVIYTSGGDSEFRLHGASVPGGEGPSFTAVNTASTGDRTVSLVSRYGPGTGGNVGVYMHMGVWDGTNWFREFDMITPGADGFLSNLRVGYGTAQINAAYTGAYQFTQNKIFAVNKPVSLGGGPLFEVSTTATIAHGELKVTSINAPLRHCAPDGTPNWSWLDQYPAVNQLALFDHNTSTNKITFTSTGDTIHLGNFRPSGDNANNLGSASNRFAVVYAGTGAINTSDEREKTFATEIDPATLRAVGRIAFRQFKFNDSIREKGDAARWHFGVGAQQVKEAFEAEGLNAFAFGLLCYDEWPEEWIDHPATYRDSTILDSDGSSQQVLERDAWIEKVRDAGNRYGVRYDELLTLQCAYLLSKLPA